MESTSRSARPVKMNAPSPARRNASSSCFFLLLFCPELQETSSIPRVEKIGLCHPFLAVKYP